MGRRHHQHRCVFVCVDDTGPINWTRFPRMPTQVVDLKTNCCGTAIFVGILACYAVVRTTIRQWFSATGFLDSANSRAAELWQKWGCLVSSRWFKNNGRNWTKLSPTAAPRVLIAARAVGLPSSNRSRTGVEPKSSRSCNHRVWAHSTKRIFDRFHETRNQTRRQFRRLR